MSARPGGFFALLNASKAAGTAWQCGWCRQENPGEYSSCSSCDERRPDGQQGGSK